MKINTQNVVLGIAFLICFVSFSVCAQDVTKTVTRNEGNFKEVSEVLKANSAIRHGNYNLFYKDYMVESGQYTNNQKTGIWQFFSFNGVLEYEYNFDRSAIVKLSGERGRQLKRISPCLYLGSPVVPYLFVVNHISYPLEALDLNISGKVVLALKINAKGELWGFYLHEKLHPLLDSEVMRVARKIPDDWQWLAATQNGKSISEEYHIVIKFEADQQ
ncbi:hypothetical protein DMA11_15145 [Marinilabiliaceae bacterium JC017]|nr:hypothetical protein DMA11_15145 [Marinilabiliaceae bacterium JC017]